MVSGSSMRAIYFERKRGWDGNFPIVMESYYTSLLNRLKLFFLFLLPPKICEFHILLLRCSLISLVAVIEDKIFSIPFVEVSIIVRGSIFSQFLLKKKKIGDRSPKNS